MAGNAVCYNNNKDMAGTFTPNKLFIVALVFLFFFAFFFAPFAAKVSHAQTASSPTFLLTWKALKSYVPAAYEGKALPGANSPISASLELIANGKLVNLKGTTINWYLDDGPIAGGAGIQHVVFAPDATPPGSMELRIEIPNYNGNYLIHAVDIPMANPTAVISGPYPQGEFSDTSLTLRALSYFTSVPASSLTYAWGVNGVQANSSENPDVAQINLPAGTASGAVISASLTITNPTDNSTAEALQTLTYVQKL